MDTFNASMDVYGEDVPIPHKKPAPKRKPGVIHDQVFFPSNPAKKGHNKTLERFPVYMENPPKRITKKVKVEGEEPPPGFKATTT